MNRSGCRMMYHMIRPWSLTHSTNIRDSWKCAVRLRLSYLTAYQYGREWKDSTSLPWHTVNEGAMVDYYDFLFPSLCLWSNSTSLMVGPKDRTQRSLLNPTADLFLRKPLGAVGYRTAFSAPPGISWKRYAQDSWMLKD
jgi:hypothetical protein